MNEKNQSLKKIVKPSYYIIFSVLHQSVKTTVAWDGMWT